VLEDLTVHLEGKDIMKEMKFIILEQKFLEHIYAGKTFEALKVLQLEIRLEIRFFLLLHVSIFPGTFKDSSKN
jgi:hypothetical protein